MDSSVNPYNCKHYLQRLDFSLQNICSYNGLDKVNWVVIYLKYHKDSVIFYYENTLHLHVKY